MRTFILIGGIGSGKSTVSRMLGELGARCIDLDAVGHEVLEMPQARFELVKTFGEGVLAPDGSIDRRALAAQAFATPLSVRALNKITQPRIVERAMQAIEVLRERGCAVAVVEVSAYEGPGGMFDPLISAADGILAVVAPEDVRASRAVERGLSEADVRNRMARQATDGQRESWADIVIRNDGSVEHLRSQVEAAWSTMASVDPDAVDY